MNTSPELPVSGSSRPTALGWKQTPHQANIVLGPSIEGMAQVQKASETREVRHPFRMVGQGNTKETVHSEVFEFGSTQMC